MKARKARLELTDGRSFPGTLFGAQKSGEVVFTTAMTGYGEVMTDPSFAGQIVVMTFPMIGNYGVHKSHLEAGGLRALGLVTRQLSLHPHHPTADTDLIAYMADEGGFILTDVDTRALTRHLRQHGTVLGQVVAEGEAAGAVAPFDTPAMVAATTTRTVRHLGHGTRVTVIDYGLKEDIVRELAKAGLAITVLPWDATPEQVAASEPTGVVLSNGPGDPKDLTQCAAVVRQVSERYPTFGICLGHQLLALAYGGSTFKLPFGHRGANHPVIDAGSGEVAMTSQNHGYAVDPDSLEGSGLAVSHRNLNDGTVEGLRHESLPVFSLQYHPEAGPGPWDERTAFTRFVTALGRGYGRA